MARIMYVVPDFHMGCQHEGTRRQLKLNKVDVNLLKSGDVVVCINRRKTLLRLWVGLNEKETFGFLGTYRAPNGQVPMECVRFICDALGSDGFDMNKAIRLGLERALSRSGNHSKAP